MAAKKPKKKSAKKANKSTVAKPELPHWQEPARVSGRPNHQPRLVLYYTHAGKHVGAILHPKDPELRIAHVADGPHTVLGLFRDAGWVFGDASTKTPQWILDRLPEGAADVVNRTIVSFPFRQ